MSAFRSILFYQRHTKLYIAILNQTETGSPVPDLCA
jgi:hypothetical protein